MSTIVIDKEKVLSKAKIGLLNKPNATFISTIVMSLKSSWGDSLPNPDGSIFKNPTACTDGINLTINEDWFLKVPPLEQIGLLAHEAWHVALQHVLPERTRGKDPHVYNQAADHVINLMLLDHGFRIPKGGLCDRAYAGMSTEQVYDILIKDPSKQDPNFQPDYQSTANPDPVVQKQHQNNVADILTRAATQAKLAGDAAGSIPGEILIALDKLLNPKLPWHVILHDYFNGLANDDYSYQRPNRRFLPMFLPTLYSEGMGTFATAFDTSGSTSDHALLAFGTEIDKAIEDLCPEKVFVVDFDTRINTIHDLVEGERIVDIKFKGRGGTDLQPVFDHFAKKPPHVLVIFSDLECDPIEKDPGYPVVWIKTPGYGHTPTFGKIIEYDPED